MLGVPSQMDKMAGSGKLNDILAALFLQKIRLNKVARVSVRAQTPNHDSINTRIYELAENMSPDETAGTGQKYSHYLGSFKAVDVSVALIAPAVGSGVAGVAYFQLGDGGFSVEDAGFITCHCGCPFS